MKAIVTGVSSGIGKETVKSLCAIQETSLIAVSRNVEKLNKLQEECEKEFGKTIDVYQGDIAEQDFSIEFASYIKEKDFQPNILINNAGQLIHRAFDEVVEEDVSTMYGVNVFGPIWLIQRLAPLMNKEYAHVVNIGSMGGYQGSAKFPGLSIYSSTKAALANLTECLAEEYTDKGIKFNCLALGAVQTEMLTQAFPEFNAPLDAKQMGSYVAQFAMEGGRYYNGKVLPVSISTP